MVARVHAALAEGRLRVYSQPIIRLATGDRVSEELLVRIVTEDGEVLPAAAFVPAAERHGLMPKIDRFVIDRAAALAASGRFVHANLSATTISDFSVFGDILTVMHTHRAEASRITFEITETAAAASMQNATRLADRLRALRISRCAGRLRQRLGSFPVPHCAAGGHDQDRARVRPWPRR